MAIIIYAFQDVYKKTHIQSVYNITGWKLNLVISVIIKLFWRKDIIFV